MYILYINIKYAIHIHIYIYTYEQNRLDVLLNFPNFGSKVVSGIIIRNIRLFVQK